MANAYGHDYKTRTFSISDAEVNKYKVLVLDGTKNDYAKIATGATTEVPIGVAMTYGVQDEAIPVIIGGEFPCIATGSLAIGDPVKAVADGKVAKAGASDKVLGIAMNIVSAANEFVTIKID